MAKHWMQKVSESIKRRGTAGKCTPISKASCKGKARALALTFKKIARKRKHKKEDGGEISPDEVEEQQQSSQTPSSVPASNKKPSFNNPSVKRANLSKAMKRIKKRKMGGKCMNCGGKV